MKLSTSALIWIFLWSLFMGVTAISIGFGALFPDMNRIAKPFVCPNGRMDVVQQIYNPYPGSTITTTTWYCIDSRGGKTELGIFPMSLYAGIIYGFLLFLVIIIGISILNRNQKLQLGSRTEQDAEQPMQFREKAEARRGKGSGGVAAKMKELKELRDANLISEAEYQSKRAEILKEL